MRTNLKIFRLRQKLSQEEMARKIGCTRVTYASVENGRRCGRESFWNNLQKAFDVPDENMWPLTKNEKK